MLMPNTECALSSSASRGHCFQRPHPKCSLLLIRVDELYYRNSSPEEVEGRIKLLHHGGREVGREGGELPKCDVILYPVTQ